MQKPTKIMLSGTLVALLFISISLLWTNHLGELEASLNTHKQSLLSQCKQLNKEQYQKTHADLPKIGGWEDSFVPEFPFADCPPVILSAQENDELEKDKIQKTRGHTDLFAQLGLFILFFSALPWLWYFLLRRLKELREAILDK
jgi:hypothetical protein